ncbi:hypothetical protein Ciccas_001467 [Cichlidogyrus casuarinus]|uniref:Ammonium transporter AmtB-like domain-containing protein n=1 Tax=Cichlidogyrus casuarinus TaxID=1844966 RepID=A0ABD2QJY0_9PLAT
MKSTYGRFHPKGFVLVAMLLQALYIIIYGVLFRYSDDMGAEDEQKLYPLLQDVQGMIFVGFGFLMAFLKRYGFSSVGINFFLSGILIQHALIVNGICHMISKEKSVIYFKVSDIVSAEVATAAVLISFGSVLGKCSLVQYMLMGVIELIIFRLNYALGHEVIKAVDAGDSMFVHAFGAYFGIGVSAVLCRNPALKHHALEGSSAQSDMFAMIGTLFLWVYWPSFNSAAYSGAERARAIVNTIISLLACVVATFTVCSIIPVTEESDPNPAIKQQEDQSLLGVEETKKKDTVKVTGVLDMVCVQNSTLTGGVAIGTAAAMLVGAHSAAIIGFLAGTISVIGYKYVSPRMNKLSHDTCGVHNLHGMPAVLAGVVGAVFAFMATEEQYGKDSFKAVFPRPTDEVS